MSATGTPTPNIGLRIPLGTDPASVDDINYNSNLIDTKLGAVGNDSVQDQIDSVQDQIDSVQDQIDELNSKLTNIVKTKNYPISISVAGNSAFTSNYNPSADSGYKIIGVAGYDIAWNHCEVYGLYYDSVLHVRLQNTSSTAMSNVAMDIQLLEIRT